MFQEIKQEQLEKRTIPQIVDDIESGRYRDMKDIYDTIEPNLVQELATGQKIILVSDKKTEKPIGEKVSHLIQESVRESGSEIKKAMIKFYNKKGEKFLQEERIEDKEKGISIIREKDGQGHLVHKYEGVSDNRGGSSNEDSFYINDGQLLCRVVLNQTENYRRSGQIYENSAYFDAKDKQITKKQYDVLMKDYYKYRNAIFRKNTSVL